MVLIQPKTFEVWLANQADRIGPVGAMARNYVARRHEGAALDVLLEGWLYMPSDMRALSTALRSYAAYLERWSLRCEREARQ